jgi:23S rRNA (uridine2552-2'-O)-methyltransferase
MPQSKSSARWLKEHFNDPYVKRAQQEGYRSRSAYKLLEIQERDHLIKPGMVVVDLGAAPGGWSQLSANWVGKEGRVFALDILPMDPLPDVTFIQGDFQEDAVFQALLSAMGTLQADLVISDMAPNMSGMNSVDQPRAMYLAELALQLASLVLKPKGALLVKAFQGVGFEAYLRDLRGHFEKVVIRKPKASRSRSSEVYLLAKAYRKI